MRRVTLVDVKHVEAGHYVWIILVLPWEMSETCAVTLPSMKPTFLITGATGMLGTAVAALLGESCVALGQDELDITDTAGIAAVLDRFRPDVILNCAAATDVDLCETDHDYADAANMLGPANLARAARAAGKGLVHVSTDFVFDGKKKGPYREEDAPRPLNYYGSSKLEGEREVMRLCPQALVVRTSWSFGPGSANFPAKVLGWAREGRALLAADDQFGSPTYTPHLARGIMGLLRANASGLFHLAGVGTASRFQLAQATLRAAGLEVEVKRGRAADFPAPAARPLNSALDCSRAASLGVALPPWREGLRAYLDESANATGARV